jgi:phosphoribosyl-ATP pyrophosphohydrolase
MKTFDGLFLELEAKKVHSDPQSSTVKLLEKGKHAIGKKIIEEAGEVWMAAEYETPERLAEEISQLIYHCQVMMLASGLKPEDIYRKL